MAPKKRKNYNVPPDTRPQFTLEALSAPGGIEAAIETLVHERTEGAISWEMDMLSCQLTQIPDVLLILLSSESSIASWSSHWRQSTWCT